MLEYVRSFPKADSPDFSNKVATRPVEAIQKTEFAKARTKSAASKRVASAERRHAVPRNCQLNVTNNRIAEIYRELRILKLDEAPNAIAVLLRVFLELSVDHFLTQNGRSLSFPAPGGRDVLKPLDKKLAETVEIMVGIGVPKKDFDPITRSLSVAKSPMNVELLHMYVHNRFATPIRSELSAAWDHAQPLLEKIWP